eukprot:2505273-Rhodomonas_salina.2
MHSLPPPPPLDLCASACPRRRAEQPLTSSWRPADHDAGVRIMMMVSRDYDDDVGMTMAMAMRREEREGEGDTGRLEGRSQVLACRHCQVE